MRTGRQQGVAFLYVYQQGKGAGSIWQKKSFL